MKMLAQLKLKKRIRDKIPHLTLVQHQRTQTHFAERKPQNANLHKTVNLNKWTKSTGGPLCQRYRYANVI